MPLTKIKSLGITDGTILGDDIADGAVTIGKLNDLANPFGKELLHVRDEKSSSTDGGTFTSGSFQTRTLNTSVTNEISGASLASNQITLPSGTYFIFASAPSYSIERQKLKLRNTTDSSDTLIGSNPYSGAGAGSTALLIGRFTIAAQKTFEIQHRCAATIGGNGFGAFSGFATEVYTDVQIWKVA